MKLIGLYVENFGCLHQYDLKFGDGLTVIHEPNGSGKTTLAEFIRAMFYGFPRSVKTLDKNRRRKYLPWNGGKCGGHLTFEFEGTAYRIERTFGDTPKTDRFGLIDLTTNKKSTRFSDNIGVELFQLDGESFERSTYMPQLHDLGSLNTDSIRAKLGNLVEDTNDINHFDKAVAALRKKRNTYMLGSGGTVAEARRQISKLQMELDGAQEKQEALKAVQTELTDLHQQLQAYEKALTAVREQITAGSQAAAADTVRRQYEHLRSQEEACAAAEKANPLAENTPTQEQIDAARSDCEAYLALSAQLRNLGLTGEEQEQLARLNRFFAPGIPDEEKLEELTRQHREVLRLELAAENRMLSSDERQQKEELAAYFEGRGADREVLDRAASGLDRAAWLHQENLRLREEMNGLSVQRRGGIAVIGLILGVLAVAAGIALLTAGKHIPGGIALGAGVLSLIAAGYVGIRQMISREISGTRAELLRRINRNEAEATELEERVLAVTRRFDTGRPAQEVLEQLRAGYGRYLSLVTREKELLELRGKIMAERKVCEAALQLELMPYFGATEAYERAIMQLRMWRSRLLDLRAKAEAARAESEEGCRQADMLHKRLSGFFGCWFPEPSPPRFQSLLVQMQRHYDDLLGIRSRRAEISARLEAFYETHRTVLDIPAVAGAPDLESLKQRERYLTGVISDLTRKGLERKQLEGQLRHELDRIPQIRDSLDAWQLRKDEDTKKAGILSDTMEYLHKAKDSLSGNYLGAIRGSFARLLGRMVGEEPDRILITDDLEVRLERLGQSRELAFFSAGQADMVMLCMRFALVDALFPTVKPFVILDDPFVNLDDARTTQALSLLKELAQDRQIVYLVCNSSRV